MAGAAATGVAWLVRYFATRSADRATAMTAAAKDRETAIASLSGRAYDTLEKIVERLQTDLTAASDRAERIDAGSHPGLDVVGLSEARGGGHLPRHGVDAGPRRLPALVFGAANARHSRQPRASAWLTPGSKETLGLEGGAVDDKEGMATCIAACRLSAQTCSARRSTSRTGASRVTARGLTTAGNPPVHASYPAGSCART